MEIEENGIFVFCPYYKKMIESVRMCWFYKEKLKKKCILFKGIREITGDNPKRFILCEFRDKELIRMAVEKDKYFHTKIKLLPKDVDRWFPKKIRWYHLIRKFKIWKYKRFIKNDIKKACKVRRFGFKRFKKCDKILEEHFKNGYGKQIR